MSPSRVLALALTVVGLVAIPAAALGYAGLRVGDAICTETGEGLPDFSCLGHVLGGFVLGAAAGLALGVMLAVRVVRRARRRSPA